MSELAAATWPCAQAAQGQAALAQACRLPGAETEPAQCGYPEVSALLRRGPALVTVPGGIIAVRRATHRTAHVVTPGGGLQRLPLDAVRAAACATVEAPVTADVEALLDAGAVPARRRHTARAKLLQTRLSGEWVTVGAALMPARASSWWALARAAGLWRPLAVVLAAHTAVYALFLVSWALIGADAAAGTVTTQAVLTWSFVILGLLAARVAATWSAGRLGLSVGRLLKRRLLAGVQRLEPEEIRTQGAGQLLGTVLEAEQLETLALTGGYLGFLGAVELVAAGVALAAGARGGLLVAVLALWLGVALALGRVALRRRKSWTSQRLALTHDLVERLVGHRTRLAFEGASVHELDAERAALATYAGRAGQHDRAEAALVAVVPHGFLATGAALLVLHTPAAADPAALAVGVGGLLLGSQALRKLTLGLAQLTGAAVAGSEIAPLMRAARRPPRTTGGEIPGGPAPLLQAREIVFAHPGRAEPVLAGANLTVHHGDRVLLEGASGAGKSTLASLLAGVRLPASGSLLLAGADRHAVADEAWRRHVVVAPQFGENHVFSASVAFNLLLGRHWPPSTQDLADAEEVCRNLGLGTLLDEMPAGFAQPLGETGWQLSHGERSRLFAARALLSRAELVVFDESFAALDPEALRQALTYVLERAPTVLVIAHE